MHERHRLSFVQWVLIAVLVLAISVGFILLGITAFNGGPVPRIEPLGSPIYLRGDGIALLRLPDTVVPLQKVEIYADGSAIRGLNPSQPNKSTKILLTSSEQHELNQLRAQWCQQSLSVRPLVSDEPFYDLGFRCGDSYDVKQARLPVDMLPTILSKILGRLPPIPDS